MMNAFNAYMIMKEGTMSEQFVGFFATPSTVCPTTIQRRQPVLDHIAESELGKLEYSR
ncbi:hypothetical protein RND71_019378 [Anisodus tanguticus]|uniref:Uncharacterized protein n=1 Tax=Anisodus tanguticus TaxID=243964 RepID=A0AAE1S0S1_9SOLA|nr:hypothetical protein RND71_019378 [Anisodus tanguticus]